MKCFKHEFNAKYQPVLSVWAYAADPVQAAILAQGYVIRTKPLYNWKRFKQVPVENADISVAQAPMVTTVRPRTQPAKNDATELRAQASYLDNGAGGVDFFDAKVPKWTGECRYDGAHLQPDYSAFEVRILADMSPEALANMQTWAEKAAQRAQDERSRARRAKGMAAFNALTEAELERAKAVLLAATGVSADDPYAKVYLSASRQPDYVRVSMGANKRHTNMLRHWLLRHGIQYQTGNSPTRVLACDLLPLLGYATQIG
jgi:hypothetical protein